MVDTAKSVSALQSLLADNTVGDISAQDVRDFLVSSLGVYGSITVVDANAPQGTLGTTPAKLTAFVADGNSNGTTPAHASDQITIGVAGNYDVFFQCAFSGTGSAIFQFRLRVDGVETSPVVGCTRKMGSAGDVGSASFLAPAITLAVNEVLTIYVETDDVGDADTMTVVDAQLSVKMVG